MRNIIIALIGFYQNTISPDHGQLKHLYPYGYCRHEPTCSEYAKKIIADRGLIIGCTRSFFRILTCNPWKKPSEERIVKVLLS